MKVRFSKNQYNINGDLFDECVLIHIDDKFIIRLNDKHELSFLIETLQKIKKEINKN